MAGDVNDPELPARGEEDPLAAAEDLRDGLRGAAHLAHPGRRLLVVADPVVGAEGAVAAREDRLGVGDELAVECAAGDREPRVRGRESAGPALVIEGGVADHEQVEVARAEPEPGKRREHELLDARRAARLQEHGALPAEGEGGGGAPADLGLDAMDAFDDLHHSANWKSEAPPSTSRTEPVM